MFLNELEKTLVDFQVPASLSAESFKQFQSDFQSEQETALLEANPTWASHTDSKWEISSNNCFNDRMPIFMIAAWYQTS